MSGKPVGIILVVDDEAPFLKVFRLKLEQMGYSAILAETGSEALRLLRQFPVSIVISDIMMAPMDGFDLCREIRKCHEWDHIPILLLSVANDAETRIAGLEAGADGFLPKPFRLREFKAQMDALRRFQHRAESAVHSGTLHHPSDGQVQQQQSSTQGTTTATASSENIPGTTSVAGSSEHLQRGMAALRNGDYEGAIAWLSVAVRQDKTNIEARAALAQAEHHFFLWVIDRIKSLDYAIKPIPQRPEDIYNLDLTRDESLVFGMLNGQRTAQETALASKIGYHKTLRIIVRLFEKGAIVVEDEDGAQYSYDYTIDE